MSGFSSRRSSSFADMSRAGHPPLVEILRKFVNFHSQDIPESPYSQFIRYIPSIDKNQVHKISQNLTHDPFYPDLLSHIAENFRFNSQILINFIEVATDSKPISEIGVLIPAAGVIAWISSPDLSADIDSFVILLDSVIMIKECITENLYNFMISEIIKRFLDSGLQPFPGSIVKKLFTKCTAEQFDLLVSILNNVIINRDVESARHIMGVMTNAISSYPLDFICCDLSMISDTLVQNICEFDIYSLNLLGALGGIREDENLIQVFKDLPEIIKNRIMQNSVVSIFLPEPKESEITEIDRYEQKQEVSIHVDNTNTFPDGLKTPTIADFETKLKDDDLVSSEMKEIFHKLITLISGVQDEYADVFFSAFTKKAIASINQDAGVDILISFLYLMGHVGHVNITEEIFNFLSSDYIFRPGVSIFNQCENFDLVSHLRQTVLHIFMHHSQDHVCKLLQKFESNCFLFTDVIGRIHMKLGDYLLTIFTNESTLAAIIHVLSNFNTLLASASSSVLSTIQEARSTIFLFIFAILENTQIAAKCFASSVFASGFLSRILDRSLETPIIAALRNLFMKYESTDLSDLEAPIGFLCGIIDVCKSHNDKERHDNVVLDLLLCIDESMQHNPSVSPVFVPFISSATQYVITHPSTSVLRQTLHIYSQLLLSSKVSLARYQIQQLSMAIRTADGEHPSEETLFGLIGMISRSRSVNTNSMFFIHEPLIILLLFSVIQTYEETIKYIQLFTDLCHHSAYNCIQSHRGELDLVLLELIRNFPNSYTFRGCEFNLKVTEDDIKKRVLPLISAISLYSCSPQTAHKIISIITPKNKTEFPKFSSEIMSLLSSSLSCLTQNPKVSIPLGYKNSFILIKSIHTSQLAHGFTYQCSIIIDSPYSLISPKKPIILFLTDDYTTQIYFYFHGNSVICRIISAQNTSFAALANNLPSCKWLTATITIQHFEDNTSAVTFATNEMTYASYSVILPPFKDGLLTMQLGGILDDGTEVDPGSDFMCNLGSFRFFGEALDKKQMADLNLLGSSRKGDANLIPLFDSAELTKDQLKSMTVNSDMRIDYSILDAFSHKQTIKKMLPFFLYLPSMPNHFPELLIDIIQCVVTVKQEYHFFPIIGSMLLLCPPEKLTYSIYLKFFNILENCTDTKVIKDLLKSILFNFELWIPIEASQLSRIVQHWVQNLYFSSPKLFSECFPFPTLLSLIRIYFWYEPIEIEFIHGLPDSSRPRDPNLDIDTCRVYLNRLLYSIVCKNFTLKEVEILMSHCVVCNDIKQVIAFLNIFLDIMSMNDIIVDIPSDICRLLYHQFRPQSEIRFTTALKILYNFAKGAFSEHLDALISSMNKYYYTKELFDQCFDMLQDYPLIYPLCVITSLNIGKEHAEKVAVALSNIQLQKKVVRQLTDDVLWPIWAIILAASLEPAYHIFIYNFIFSVIGISPRFDSIDRIISFLDLLSFTNPDMETFGKTFILKMAEHFFNTANKEMQPGIILRCLKYLLLHITYDKQWRLNIMYRDSPFYQNESKRKRRPTLFQNISDLISIAKNPIPQTIYYTGLKLDESGKPMEFKLYNITMKLMSEVTEPNESIVFWNNCFNTYFHNSNEYFEYVNMKAGTYFENSIRYYTGQINRFRELIIHRYSKTQNNKQLSFDMINNRESTFASIQVEIANQEIKIESLRNSVRLKKLKRKYMHECSPWNDPENRLTCRIHDFKYCSLNSQPLLKYSVDKSLNLSTIIPIDRRSQKCVLIKFTHDVPARFIIKNNCFEIEKASKTISIDFRQIQRIFRRTRYHKNTCLEVFTNTGRSYLIDFSPFRAKDVILNNLKINNYQAVQFQEPKDFLESSGIKQQWLEGRMSNFEYIMKLNEYSGRSFNDSHMYPIFPWIVDDYKCDDWRNAKLRDLSKPIAAQRPRRTSDFTSNFTYFVAPSNPTLVNYYLKKICPYNIISESKMFEKYYLSEEQFSSIEESYDLAVTNSNCWELTPEFFYAPEFFEGVKLPKWANDDPQTFVYLHRKILESDEVSKKLNEWIDLIFGVALHDKVKATEMMNVFAPILFSDFESDAEISLDSTLMKIGQLPEMLFSSPHPSRFIRSRDSERKQQIIRELPRNDIRFACILKHDSNSASFLALCDNNSVCSFTIEFDQEFISPVVLYQNLHILDENPLLCSFQGGFILMDKVQYNFYLITPQTHLSRYYKTGHPLFLASSSDLLSVIYSNGNIGVWNSDLSYTTKFSISNDYLVCYSINKHFDIVVGGTVDGILVAHSLSNGSFLFSSQLDENAMKIKITDSWGFIVVETENFLELFNINGKLIKKAKISFTIENWISWKCEKGFDFILIADTKHQLRMSEVFLLNFDESIASIRSPIIKMHFDIESRTLFAITKDQKMRLIPVPLPP